MAYPVLTGATLIEANGAALNNAGLDTGRRVENAVIVKQIRIGRFRYPYISGQAWRRWWREVLYQDFGWQPSPVTREKKIAYTAGDPITYEEDDLFGYMVARKRGDTQGTYRRISPLKNSLLISVLPNVISDDYGHFSRNLPPGVDIIPFESEHYTTYLQGVFTISLVDVGRFTIGEMADLSEDLLKSLKEQLEAVDNERVYRLPQEERIKRIRQVVQALATLRGGARLARNLSDVSPVVVLVGFLNGGNAPFQRLFIPDENYENILLDLDRLRSVLEDYKDRTLKSSEEAKPIFFGYRPNTLANEKGVLSSFKNEKIFSKYIEIVGSPKDALKKVASEVPEIFTHYKF